MGGVATVQQLEQQANSLAPIMPKYKTPPKRQKACTGYGQAGTVSLEDQQAQH